MKPTIYLTDIEIEHLKAGHSIHKDSATVNFTSGSKIRGNLYFDNREPFKKVPVEYVTFVCVSSSGQDAYYEDENSEYGNEIHTIERKYRVHNEIVPLEEAKKFYNDYLDQNADNPPYDTYSIKLAYWSATQEPISLRQFQGDE